jgi:hypothetical protein
MFSNALDIYVHTTNKSKQNTAMINNVYLNNNKIAHRIISNNSFMSYYYFINDILASFCLFRVIF